jgi:ABC-type lipoprotein export system ATPase subunit
MGIEIQNVKKWFGPQKVEILKGISDTIKNGERVCITGRSGSGKSTLLYIISTLDRASEGRVIIDGRDTATLSMSELHHFRNQKMGFVFQFHYLLPELTALENVLMPTLKVEGVQRKEAHLFAEELLKGFELGHRFHHTPSELSGGEQQRVAIARALVMRPQYLFADEPTGNLDSTNARAVMKYFEMINQKYGTTIIYVTHDREFSQLSHRQVNLVDGLIA